MEEKKIGNKKILFFFTVVVVLLLCLIGLRTKYAITETNNNTTVQTVNDLLEFYHTDKSIISMLTSMLGADEDRLYLIAAQNSSEIRASGGFPGSIGTIRIQNGVLTMGEFRTVYDVLSSTTSSSIKITSEEYRLFNFLSGIQAPRDADLCPDFECVALI